MTSTETPRVVVVALSLLFALAMLAAAFTASDPGHLGLDEYVWGFYWLRDFSPGTRVAAVSAVFVTAIPAVNRSLRRVFARTVRFVANATGAAGPSLVVASLTVVSWLLRSQAVYGDGLGTIYELQIGEVINWKEPLDRFITSRAYVITNQMFGWKPAPAIALVSCAAGIGYWTTALALARLIGADLGERVAVFLLLVSIGAVQVFFGNVENYSLLGAGTTCYLYAGLRYLRTGRGFDWAVVALAVTACIHLSAVWLVPTLAVLAWLGLAGDAAETLRLPRPTPEARRRFATEARSGFAAAALVSGITLTLGTYFLGSTQGLSQDNFGGGDGRMWVPLFETSTQFEKFTMFSVDHLAAVANEVLLICPTGVVLVVGYLLAAPNHRQGCDRVGIFLISACASFLTYIFLFNPDQAGVRVGILNEWDLFSPPAWPLIVLGAWLWKSRGREDRERQHYVATVVIATGMVHASAWILSNAGARF